MQRLFLFGKEHKLLQQSFYERIVNFINLEILILTKV
jgi:hypothetical protein